MNKKFLSIVSVLALLLLSAVGTSAAVNPSDITGHQYEPAIRYLYQQGVVEGYGDGTFRPEYELNRAELIKFVLGNKVTPSPTIYKNCFPDVKEDWYAKYVCYAKSRGWIEGYPDNLFRPAQKVNNVEAVKILVRANELSAAPTTPVPFSDVDLSQWYGPFLRSAQARNLLIPIQNSTGYSPGNPMTRGEVSEMMYRLMSGLSSPPAVSEGNSNRRLTEADLHYLGAFRLPLEGSGESRFGYGGWAMTLNPNGDPNNDGIDSFPGSLYIVGHDHHQLVAEVTIPTPKDQRNLSGGVENLNVARYLQTFGDITGGMAKTLDGGNGYKVSGLGYFNNKLYWTARKYYNVDGSNDLSHGVSDLSTTNPNAKGMWRLGDSHSSTTAGYIFTVPKYFADAYLEGRRLISGLFTQQGVAHTSQGPAMFAYGIWSEIADSAFPTNGAKLNSKELVYYPYEPIFKVNGDPESNFPNHKVPDAWMGATWVNTPDAQGIVVVGQRAMGPTYYGDARPNDCSIDKGYHGTPYEPRFVFYDPADLALVAQGKKKPADVIPYLEWNPQQYFVQTCFWSLTGAAYDEARHLLYVMHRGADTKAGEPQPLIYVFKVGN